MGKISFIGIFMKVMVSDHDNFKHARYNRIRMTIERKI